MAPYLLPIEQIPGRVLRPHNSSYIIETKQVLCLKEQRGEHYSKDGIYFQVIDCTLKTALRMGTFSHQLGSLAISRYWLWFSCLTILSGTSVSPFL